MKFQMAKNSLFAVLLRSPWWVSIAVAAAVALLAGAASRFATGDAISTFDELDLGSIFVAFIGAAALLLVLEATSGRRR